MLERQRLIDDICRGLATLQGYIEPRGALNLNDTSIHAEIFVAGLLNALFGWSLISANDANSNYPCIDLLDRNQGLGIQVTSEKKSAKLNKTIKCLKLNKCRNQIRSLKVFLLTTKQSSYTVNTSCPGIKFNWHTDVLDFNDVMKAVGRTDDLHQLQRVHEYIVSTIPSVFPWYEDQNPPLTTPATDPKTSWLPFSSRATTLVGRDAELSQLSKFLDSPRSFCWWLVTGMGGCGKSRLALELCRKATNWRSGFLSRTENDFNWSQFKPSRKTVIVIDYVASRAREVSDLILILSRKSAFFENPVRVLLIERNMETWWSAFSRDESQSETAEISGCQYDEPLALKELNPEAILQLAGEVVHARNGTWDATTAIKYLVLLGSLDPVGRPLFAMILAQELETIKSAESIVHLLREVLRKESGRRRQMIQKAEDLQRMENLLFLATLVGALLPRSDGFRFLSTSDVADLLPSANILNEHLYNDIASSARGDSSLSGLQPDMLGERFLLDRLSAGGFSATQTQRLLRAAWSFQPRDVRTVAVRSASDFPGEAAISHFYDLPLETSAARAQWVAMLADMIVATRGDDKFIPERLVRAASLADQFPGESALQEAAALADYNMGCRMQRWFYEGRANSSDASERFNAVVARLGNSSVIGISAVLNCGCLLESDGRKDEAIQAFTTVIESPTASDESRACAFNNRANIFAGRGHHQAAIRDRGEVLALKTTSPDRRFVALFGRSESYRVLRRYRPAHDDLCTIIDSTDIGPSDKLTARIERAAILAQHLDRPSDARRDLRWALKISSALARELRDDLRFLLRDEGKNIEKTRTTWRRVTQMVRRSANRIRIAPLRIDQDAF